MQHVAERIYVSDQENGLTAYAASCTCGWTGEYRSFETRAVQDAEEHEKACYE